MTWQPIESRPDEDRIRFIGATTDIVVGDIFYGVGSLRGIDGNPEGYFERQMVRCFRYSDSERPVPYHMTPTHWMPLPEPPTSTNKH